MSVYDRARERLYDYDNKNAYGPFTFADDQEMWMACYLGALSEVLRMVLDEIGPEE